jgi:hypothetical protein
MVGEFKLIHVFLIVYMCGALWLVVSGVASFFTRQSTFWIGSKVYSWSGKKAYWGGALTVAAGLLLLAIGVFQFLRVSQPW